MQSIWEDVEHIPFWNSLCSWKPGGDAAALTPSAGWHLQSPSCLDETAWWIAALLVFCYTSWQPEHTGREEWLVRLDCSQILLAVCTDSYGFQGQLYSIPSPGRFREEAAFLPVGYRIILLSQPGDSFLRWALGTHDCSLSMACSG